MIALFTENFETFLQRQGDTDEWKAIIEQFKAFPNFTLGNLNYDMYTLLREKYDVYEIGCEDEQLFYFHFRDKLNELLIKYVPKIQTYIANFANLLERKIALESNGDSQNYLYPISSENGQVATSVKFYGSKENPLLIFKSNTELLEQALNLKDIYLDCLAEFETVFMLIY